MTEFFGGRALSFRYLSIAVAVALAALSIDQLSKWMVVEHILRPAGAIEITPFFNLVLGYNTGVSFGLFAGFLGEWPHAFSMVKVVIVACLLLWAALSASMSDVVALGLIAGGAAGNIVDRVRQGAVTDFLDFHLYGWHWPAFNLSDVAIVSGALLMVASAVGPWPGQVGGIRGGEKRKDR